MRRTQVVLALLLALVGGCEVPEAAEGPQVGSLAQHEVTVIPAVTIASGGAQYTHYNVTLAQLGPLIAQYLFYGPVTVSTPPPLPPPPMPPPPSPPHP